MQIFQIKNQVFPKIFSFFALALLMTACNKELPEAKPIIYPDANTETTSLGSIISSEPNYSFFKAAVNRIPGLMSKLNDSSKVFTIFLPDNAAFIASGIPAEAVIGSLPLASVAGIVQYSMIPGRQLLANNISDSFPNQQFPTGLNIGTLPGTTVPIQMSVFPSRRGSNVWVNTIPVVSADHKYRNGVIHVMAALVAPPSMVLKQSIYSNPDLSYFRAAIARADSGAAGLGKLDSLLGYAVTNMTLLVPDNKAFQTLLFGSVYSALLQKGLPADIAQQQASSLISTPAVFENPALFEVLTAATVKGILAYHFLATDLKTGSGYQPNVRVFSNNFSTTPTFYQTLVNTSVGVHPGILAQATFSGPFVSGLKFTGLGTFPPGGQPYSGEAANAVSKDILAVNGVYHIIDKVLLPQ